MVVDARGLFSGRRYLLPVGKVRYDEAARMLRVNLPKDIAERYPEFDRDQFETMTDEAMSGYEARLSECFPRTASGQAADPSTGDGPPEWLMTSVCITVTPGVSARPTNEVRRDANTFAPTARGERATVSARPPEVEVQVAGPALDVAGPPVNTPHTDEPVGLPAAEPDVASGERADETVTAPHGDTLRTRI
jgi:hypothetical protein